MISQTVELSIGEFMSLVFARDDEKSTIATNIFSRMVGRKMPCVVAPLKSAEKTPLIASPSPLRKKWTDEILEQIVQRKEAGETDKAIAEGMGVKKGALAFQICEYRKRLREGKIRSNVINQPHEPSSMLVPASRSRCIEYLRSIGYAMSDLDGRIKYKGQALDDRALLNLANAERSKARLPLFKMGAA